MVKLNLGCGSKIKKDYINVDTNPPEFWRFSHYNPDGGGTIVIKHDALEIGNRWSDNTFDEIFSEFMFEHFSPADISKMLYICWKLLKPQGILKIVVPDFIKAIEYFEDNPYTWSSVNGVTLEVFGDDFETPHRSVWTKEFAHVYLEGEKLFYIQSIEPDVATNRHYAMLITAQVIKES